MNQYVLPPSGPRTLDSATLGTYEILCGHARSLCQDAVFLAQLRATPQLDLNAALRCALDMLPDLELLPLAVLAAELAAALERSGSPPPRWLRVGGTVCPTILPTLTAVSAALGQSL